MNNNQLSHHPVTPAPLRLAYFSPLPPSYSGIADYSAELLPHLAQHAQITLFVPQPEQVASALGHQFPVQPIANYPAQRWQFDLAIYHLGNSAHHAAHYEMAQRYPGVLVLHDQFLHHFIAHHTVGQGNYPAYSRELGYALGPAGVRLAWQIRYGEAEHPLFSQPLNQRLLALSLGTIVHSRYVRQQLPATSNPVTIIPALVQPHPGQSRRAALGWPEDALIFGSFGQVTAARRLDQALQAFKELRQTLPQARYLIVGGVQPEVDLEGLITRLGVGDSVRSLGHVAQLQEFVDWLHTADVVVNLRYPTMGETSAVALRALAAGKPTIVYNHGWYSELPDDACAKIPPLDGVALRQTMLDLAQNLEKRGAMGQTAVAYTTAHGHPAQVAAAYGRFLHQTLAHLQEKYA